MGLLWIISSRQCCRNYFSRKYKFYKKSQGWIKSPKTNKDFLIAVAHAKINLHLEVLGIRNDGFHELAMVMQSVSLNLFIL